MVSDKSIRAVLTGDVVASSTLPAADFQLLIEALHTGVAALEEVYSGSVFGHLDIYGGDSWQMVLNRPELALRAALLMRASARSSGGDTRVAVAWGPIAEADLNPERISQSMGDVFMRSGRQLADLPKGRRLGLAAAVEADDARLLTASLGLLDERVGNWTPSQAECVALALLGLKQAEIAQRIGKSQSTVNQSLQTAGWHPVAEFLETMANRF